MASYSSKSTSEKSSSPKLDKKVKEQLPSIRKKIDMAHNAFYENYKRFHNFQDFAFRTALSTSERDALRILNRPEIEFNLVNAPISRLCGEFSKQEPSILVGAKNSAEVDPMQIEVVEGIIRSIFYEAHKSNTQYNVYRDIISGGLSSFKVFTEYENPMSFEQVMRLARPYEPTFVGYDPTAREATKCDAEYYFEICPYPIEEFKAENPGVDVQKLKETSGSGDQFRWYYSNGDEEIIVVCHFYLKKRKKIKIVELANKKVIPLDDYEEFKKNWEDEGNLEQVPQKTDLIRETEVPYFCRYKLTGVEIFGYEETDFTMPNYIFVDGDSVRLKGTAGNAIQQFTKPYIFHARGLQKLINVAGQTITNDIESMTMHKFMLAQEALPDQNELMEAYRNPQMAQTMIYKGFLKTPSGELVQLNAPVPVPRVPLPTDVMQTFNSGLQLLQNILGTTDMQLGVQNNQLSGLAIIEAATQSNSAAMPYIVNYMQGLNQAGQVIASLIPKYYKTARTIPIIDAQGNRKIVKVNQEGGVSLDYDYNCLEVKIEAGVNFAIAKNRALQQIIALMNVSPQFANFMNQKGLTILLDNMEFQGVDILKKMVDEYLQESSQNPSPEQIQAQQAQAAQQMQQQTLQLKQQDLQLKAQELQQNMQIAAQKDKTARLDMILTAKDNEKKNMLKQFDILVEAENSDNELKGHLIDAAAERNKDNAQLQMALSQDYRATQDQEHRHLKEFMDMAHTHNKENVELEVKKFVAAKPDATKTKVTYKPKSKLKPKD